MRRGGLLPLRIHGEEVTFDHTVFTVAAPADVWAVWTDVARWPAWDAELQSASIEGNRLALGAGGVLKPRWGPASPFVVSELEEGRCYAFATRLPWGELVVRRRLEKDREGGTAFTHEVSFVGPLSFLFGVFLGGRFRAALPRVMENVRRIAESRYRERQSPPDQAGRTRGDGHDKAS